MTMRGTPATEVEATRYRVSTSPNPDPSRRIRAYPVIATALIMGAFLLTILSAVASNPGESTHRTWQGLGLGALGVMVFFYGMARRSGHGRVVSMARVLGIAVGSLVCGWLFLSVLGLIGGHCPPFVCTMVQVSRGLFNVPARDSLYFSYYLCYNCVYRQFWLCQTCSSLDQQPNPRLAWRPSCPSTPH